MMCDYMRFGGCRVDLPPGWLERRAEDRRRISRDFSMSLKQLIIENEILMARTQDVGKLSAELAINAGITGPMLRACGVNYDIRKVDGYGFYPRFKFRVPLGDHGDCYDRFMMRVLEMRESHRDSAAGAGRTSRRVRSWIRRRRSARFKPPVGEAYGRIEAPKGELGFYLISDGEPAIRIAIASVRRA